MPGSSFGNSKGLSLIEVMTSVFLSTLIFSGVYAFFNNFSQVSQLRSELDEVQHRGKIAMYVLNRDTLRAGEGLAGHEPGARPVCVIPGTGDDGPSRCLIVFREETDPETYLSTLGGGPDEKQSTGSKNIYVAKVEPAGAFSVHDKVLICSDTDWAIITLTQPAIPMGDILILRHDPEQIVTSPRPEPPVFDNGTRVIRLSTIEYSHDRRRMILQKKINHHDTKKLLTGIEDLHFLYTLDDGTVTERPADSRAIREIRFSVTLKSLGASGGQETGRRLTLTRDVTPRCLGT
jgi:hypothetical protein